MDDRLGMNTWKPLRPGDTVALIAPARAVSKEEMAPFMQWCDSHGLRVRPGRHLYDRLNQFAGKAEQRAADFVEAWTDPEVKLVFAARGGYGCVQLLPFIPEEIWWQPGKLLCGFSDITTLNLALLKRGMMALHGPMAIHWYMHQQDPGNIPALEQLLFKQNIEIDLYNTLSEKQLPFNGILTGGNLSILYSALGTPEQPDTDGKVLFIEDLDEYLYHTDRMMRAMDRAGLLKNLAGMVVGGMADMKDNAIPFGKTAEEIIREVCGSYGYPMLFGFPAGHIPKNVCLLLGAHCTFDGRFFRQNLNPVD
ncbi:MAG: LD-carboxypeptidase [Bacteroidetes bacterium]|nr:LD-carboxypeptidase [Bacteroidota bacterium]